MFGLGIRFFFFWYALLTKCKGLMEHSQPVKKTRHQVYVYESELILKLFLITGLDKQKSSACNCNIFLTIILAYVLAYFLRTHNICLIEKQENYFSVTHSLLNT